MIKNIYCNEKQEGCHCGRVYEWSILALSVTRYFIRHTQNKTLRAKSKPKKFTSLPAGL